MSSSNKFLLLAGLCVVLAACGPSQNAPQDQSAQQQPPPAQQPAAAPPPQAAAPAPADDAQAQEIAKLKAEQHRLERRQKELDDEKAARAAAAQPPPPCPDCGVVASVTPVRQEGQAGWAGTLGGAAAGGLAGNQFGKGKGNMAMTALGVVGGAFAGREVEKQVTASTVYQVSVNMEAGGTRVVTVANGQNLAPGTHVHVDGDSLLPY